MKTVLIANHYQKACGVQSFGLRVWNLIKDSPNVKYTYREMENKQTYLKYVNELKPDIILYNWHRGTMGWLTEEMVKDQPNIKHYFIFHDEFTRTNYDKYLFFGDYDFSMGRKFGEKKVLLPRPLMEYSGEYRNNEIVTIGSFGFGFWNKGYHTLTDLVNKTFDKAVLNFHIAHSAFGDPLDIQTNQVITECRRLNTNPNIKLNITRELISTDQLLGFLAGNDINVFMYDENGEGISSVIDYSLSVRRPIAISNSKMFRHISNPEIILNDKNYLTDILARGTKPLEKFYDKWSQENFIKSFERIMDETLK